MVLGVSDPALQIALVPIIMLFFAVLGIQTLASLLSWFKKRDLLANLWKRLAVAIPIISAILISVEIGPMGWGFLVGIFVLIGYREYCSGTEFSDSTMQKVTTVVLLLLIAAGMTHDRTMFAWAGENGQGWLSLGAMLAIMLLWLVPVVRDRAEGASADLGRAFVGFALCWMFLHGAFLMHLENGSGAIIFTFLVVAMGDSGALMVGRVIGKHPFRPVISPKKTWEGAIGGIIIGALCGWIGRPLLPQLGDIEVIGVAVFIAIIAATGDLALSTLKRDLGVKDWSNALPGHGGILDRVDSFIFGAPACYWALMLL